MRAAATHEADVWVMAPMVATVEEARDFVAMVEVPAAALSAREILAAARFASIGTNDLAQYALAADRLAGELADLLDPWQPALLRLVAATVEAGRALARPVGVCGEAASDPLLASCSSGSASRASRWRRRACRTCAARWRCRRTTPATRSPRRRSGAARCEVALSRAGG